MTEVSAASCVVAGDLWSIVGCGKEGIVLEHATGDVVGELIHFFPNVSEEGVGKPAANERDGEDCNSVQVYRNGVSRADGVGYSVLGVEA